MVRVWPLYNKRFTIVGSVEPPNLELPGLRQIGQLELYMKITALRTY